MAKRTFIAAHRLLFRQIPIIQYAGTVIHPGIRSDNVTTYPNQIQLRFFTSSDKTEIGVADYKEVKGLTGKSSTVLIDVREPSELSETGKIPTSINIPLGVIRRELALDVQNSEFKSKYGRDKPTFDTEIIFHCKSGMRSLKAAEAAREIGFKNLKNYKGSWLDWAEHEKLPK